MALRVTYVGHATVHMALDGVPRELKLHKSEVVAWFGTSRVGKPGVINHGTLHGTMRAELVDIDGAKHIKGSIQAHLSSSHRELEFDSSPPSDHATPRRLRTIGSS